MPDTNRRSPTRLACGQAPTGRGARSLCTAPRGSLDMFASDRDSCDVFRDTVRILRSRCGRTLAGRVTWPARSGTPFPGARTLATRSEPMILNRYALLGALLLGCGTSSYG